MGPFRAHGPSAGPAEHGGLAEAHGPPKVHVPRGHCTPPAPTLGGPDDLKQYLKISLAI